MIPSTVAVAVLTATAALLLLGHRREARRSALERAALFADVVPAMAGTHLTDDRTGYPRLVSWIDGHSVTFAVVVDSLSLRKLPVLWLEVVHHRALPVAATVSALRRPHGADFFSPNATFAHELPAPAGWPRPVRLATRGPQTAPAVSTLDAMGELLDRPGSKEVALGPRGVRVVHLLAEAEQASYRLGRRAVFGAVRVRPAEVEALGRGLLALADQVGAARPTSAATADRAATGPGEPS